MNSTYATKTELENSLRGAVTGLLKRSIVQSLPVSDIDDYTIYMVPKIGSTNNVYDEYLYVNNGWEHIGDTAVDLTNYATTSYVDTAVGGVLPTAPVNDGTYFLKNTVSSGTAIYAWERVVIGGSY